MAHTTKDVTMLTPRIAYGLIGLGLLANAAVTGPDAPVPTLAAAIGGVLALLAAARLRVLLTPTGVEYRGPLGSRTISYDDIREVSTFSGLVIVPVDGRRLYAHFAVWKSDIAALRARRTQVDDIADEIAARAGLTRPSLAGSQPTRILTLIAIAAVAAGVVVAIAAAAGFTVEGSPGGS